MVEKEAGLVQCEPCKEPKFVDRNSSVNKVWVRNDNEPVPTEQGAIGVAKICTYRLESSTPHYIQ